ncbi:MAG: YkgJ family cysteine cluster protein [Deltaproteobacteria bacterium]|nr:YkgJ family cysteine cluster protein [Deltaproteobacteria bacterium]
MLAMDVMAGRHLEILDADIARRCKATDTSTPGWPCHAGCSDCCRSLAAVPEMTEPEWERVAAAIARLDDATRAHVHQAIDDRRARGTARPIVCPLLDDATGLCRIYDARPLACRTYGYYADREGVLGCHRIATLAESDAPIVWGNHEGVASAQRALGPLRSLVEWATKSSRDSGDPGLTRSRVET